MCVCVCVCVCFSLAFVYVCARPSIAFITIMTSAIICADVVCAECIYTAVMFFSLAFVYVCSRLSIAFITIITSAVIWTEAVCVECICTAVMCFSLAFVYVNAEICLHTYEVHRRLFRAYLCSGFYSLCTLFCRNNCTSLACSRT